MSPFVLAAHSHNSRFNVPLTNSEKWSKGNSVWHSSNSIRNRKWQFHHRKKELSLKSVYKNCFPGQLPAWDWSVRRYLRLWWFSSLSGGGGEWQLGCHIASGSPILTTFSSIPPHLCQIKLQVCCETLIFYSFFSNWTLLVIDQIRWFWDVFIKTNNFLSEHLVDANTDWGHGTDGPN